MGDRRGEAELRGALGVTEHLDGHLDEARAALVRSVWMLGDTSDPKREALYLAHLGAVESARGKLPPATSSFDLARKRLMVERDPEGLAAVEVLSGALDLARAAVGEPTGRSAAEAKLAAADTKLPAVRLARLVLAKALAS